MSHDETLLHPIRVRIAQGDSIEEIAGDYSGRVSREAIAEAIENVSTVEGIVFCSLTPKKKV